MWISRMFCRVAATIPSQGSARETGMNWKSGCGWAFAVYAFLVIILTVLDVPPAVTTWLSLAITVLLACLYPWIRKEALPPLREKPAPAPLQTQPRARRSSRRRTSDRTTRKSPRSHIRSAHWHTYGTGPRRRTKIKRWVDSTPVGGFRAPQGRQPPSGNSLCPHCRIGQAAKAVQGARYCPYCGKLDCRGHRVSLRPLYCQYCGELKF